MAYEHREMSGALFKNDKREKETQPNATGTALIGGALYRISAWTKDGAKGKFQSLAFKLVESDAAEARPKAETVDLEDSIPF
jgi:hypothetical protein